MGSDAGKYIGPIVAYNQGSDFELRICFSAKGGQQYALTLDQIDDHVKQGTLPVGVDADDFDKAVTESRQISQGLSDPFTSDLS